MRNRAASGGESSSLACSVVMASDISVTELGIGKEGHVRNRAASGG